MMVHIKPNTIDGRPSTISVELMLTNLIFGGKIEYYSTGTNYFMIECTKQE